MSSMLNAMIRVHGSIWRAVFTTIVGLLLAGCSQADIAAFRDPSVAARVLFVTDENRLYGYQAEVMRGTARGAAQDFNQWHATVLNEDRQPLAVYGVWDPRLVLDHGEDTLTWELDSATSFLFDVVFPVDFDHEDPSSTATVPRLVQIRDQSLTLLLEVDITDALNEYCTSNAGANTVGCLDLEFPLPILPEPPPGMDIPNPSMPAEDRPEAVVDIDRVGDSGDVHACLPRDGETTPGELMNRLENCDIVPELLACAPLDFEPGAGLFVAGADISGFSWDYEGIAMAASGPAVYAGDGIRFDSGSSLSIALPDCIVTSVSVLLGPTEDSSSGNVGGATSGQQDTVSVELTSGRLLSSAEFPISTVRELRVSALPLTDGAEFSAMGGTALVQRIRINVPTEVEPDLPPAPAATSTATPTTPPTATQTPEPSPTATGLPTDTPTSTITPSPTSTTESPAGPECTVLVPRLNLRPGPGVNFNPPIAALGRGTALVPLARNGDAAWILVDVQNQDLRGWVSAGSQYVECSIDITDLDVTEVTPAPVTPEAVTPAPPPPQTNRPCLVYDFESFGGWQRGDEQWGEFTLSSDQVFEGTSAGKLEYAIPLESRTTTSSTSARGQQCPYRALLMDCVCRSSETTQAFT